MQKLDIPSDWMKEHVRPTTIAAATGMPMAESSERSELRAKSANRSNDLVSLVSSRCQVFVSDRVGS